MGETPDILPEEGREHPDDVGDRRDLGSGEDGVPEMWSLGDPDLEGGGPSGVSSGSVEITKTSLQGPPRTRLVGITTLEGVDREDEGECTQERRGFYRVNSTRLCVVLNK